MRLKYLFTVPTGQKITERHLHRVLISSICSILLCMTCLVSTTWAWFAVSIENTENVIQITTVSEAVTITNTDGNEVSPVDGVYNLKNGVYSVRVQLTSNATGPDDLNKPETPVYVLMSITYSGTEGGVKYYYFSFDGGAGEAAQTLETLEISDEPAELRFSVTWVKPDAADPIGDETAIIGEKPTEPTEIPTTVPTTIPEETTEATEETTVLPTTEPETIPGESTASVTTELSIVPSEPTTPTESG